MKDSVGRAKFVRQLSNLRDMLEREPDAGDTEAEIRQLQTKIEDHDKNNHIKSFHTKDGTGTVNKRKRLDKTVNDGGGAGGGVGGVGAVHCAELGAHGYQVKPRLEDIPDGMGGVMKLLRSKVRQPLSTLAPR